MFKRAGPRGSQYRSKKIDPIRIHISYEGASDEEQYFTAWKNLIPARFERLVELVPIKKTNDNESAPVYVLRDLLLHLDSNKVNLKNNVDVACIVIDVDHYFTRNHARQSTQAVTDCKHRNINVICNCPCVEIWFLCHYESPADWPDEIKRQALENKGGFLKSRLKSFKNGESMTDMLKRTPTAKLNAYKLRLLSQKADAIPPNDVMANLDKIWNIMEASGIDISEILGG